MHERSNNPVFFLECDTSGLLVSCRCSIETDAYWLSVLRTFIWLDDWLLPNRACCCQLPTSTFIVPRLRWLCAGCLCHPQQCKSLLVFSNMHESAYHCIRREEFDLTRVPLPALVFCGELHCEGKQPELNAKDYGLSLR